MQKLQVFSKVNTFWLWWFLLFKMYLSSNSRFCTLPGNSWSKVFGSDKLWGKAWVQLFAQAWSRLSLSSLFSLRSQTHSHHLFPQKICQCPRHRTLCVYGYSSFLLAFPMLRCPGHSQRAFRCPWPCTRGGHRVVSHAETPGSCPRYGKEGAKTLEQDGSYQPFNNSPGNKEKRGRADCGTASPPLPAGKTPGTGMVPGWGGAKSRGVRESSFPTAISTGFVRQHRARSQLWGVPDPAPSGPPPPRPLAAWGTWGIAAAQGSPVGKGIPGGTTAASPPTWDQPRAPGVAGWLPAVLAWEPCSCPPRRDVARVRARLTCVRSGPARLIIMPPVGGTFPQILTFWFFHMLPYGPIFLHKQSCTRPKKRQLSFTFVMSKPEVTWLW